MRNEPQYPHGVPIVDPDAEGRGASRSGPDDTPLPQKGAPPPEKCLNCGALVAGRYCPDCGQEHSQKVVSLGHLLEEFVADTFSWDSKLLRTIGLLLFRPGRLTNEYNAGRRVSYLSPWRLYVFTSVALFYVLSLNLSGGFRADNGALRPLDVRTMSGDRRVSLTWKGGEGARRFVVRRASSPQGPFQSIAENVTERRYTDAGLANKSLYYYRVIAVGSGGRQAESATSVAMPGSQVAGLSTSGLFVAPDVFTGDINLNGRRIRVEDLPRTIDDYEARQDSLPPEKRDPPVVRFVCRKAIYYRNMGADNMGSMLAAGLLENIPRGMFVLLPLFALLLKLIYLRRGRLYIEHLVFALHAHAFIFTLLALDTLARHIVPGVVVTVLVLVYVLAAMRSVYRQSWLKTVAKFSVLSFSYLFLFALTLSVVAVATIFTS